jgi:Holliday junction DNA helicase RuvA
MIAKLKGIVDTIGIDFAIIDVQGVGYFLSCSQQTLNTLEKEKPLTIFIESYVKNEQLALCGFITEEEQQAFRLLISVQGVGTKVALSLLSILKPSKLYQAIAQQDKAMISQADGVGLKLASRIINELKDKIKLSLSDPSPTSLGTEGSYLKDAVSALTNLGYRYQDALDAASKVLKEVGPTVSLDVLIRKGLQHLNITPPGNRS